MDNLERGLGRWGLAALCGTGECARSHIIRSSVLHRGDEAVTAAGQRLDIAGTGGGIAERLAQLVYGRVQAVVEIDEGVGGPEFLAQLFAGDYLAGAVKQ